MYPFPFTFWGGASPFKFDDQLTATVASSMAFTEVLSLTAPAVNASLSETWHVPVVGDPPTWADQLTGTVSASMALSEVLTITAPGVDATLSENWPVPSTPAPVAPVASVGSPTTNSITVSWTHSGANTTDYEVRRNGALIYTTADNTPRSYTATGLASATSYSFTVTAVGPGGSTVSNTATGSTLSPAPSAPTVSIGTVTQTTVPVTVSGASNATSITLYRGATAIQTGSASGFSYTDTGLSANTTYSYHAEATGPGGTTAGGSVNATTLKSPPTVAPTVTATLGGSGQTRPITVSWSDGESLLEYFDVYRSTNGGSYSLLQTVDSATFSISTTGLEGNSYTFQVKARNNGGSGPAGTSGTVSVPMVAPDAPSSFAVTGHTTNSVSFSWSYPGSPTVAPDGFIIYNDTLGTSTTIANPLATTGTFTGLSPNTSYSFHIVAYASGRPNSGSGGTAGTTTDPLPTCNAPGSFSASGGPGTGQASFSWVNTQPGASVNVEYNAGTGWFGSGGGTNGATAGGFESGTGTAPSGSTCDFRAWTSQSGYSPSGYVYAYSVYVP